MQQGFVFDLKFECGEVGASMGRNLFSLGSFFYNYFFVIPVLFECDCLQLCCVTKYFRSLVSEGCCCSWACICTQGMEWRHEHDLKKTFSLPFLQKKMS